MGRFDFLRELIFNPQIKVLAELRPESVVSVLAVAAFCGFIIFLVYRFFNRGVLYSENFNLLIIMVTIVTAFIIITIGTNLVLTLGMVGALSVVRFRAAIKDPLDVGFLFWGVAAGLTAGARLYPVALIGTAFIAVIYIAFTMARFDKRAFLLIIRYGNAAEAAVLSQLGKINHKLKNKTVNNNFTEITVEVKVNKNNTSFIDSLKETENVDNVVLVEYTGDYA
ncbi:MAG: DUF4956 domain-containing protein [Clostridiales bacterium]|jgi:hypothetical protein|nr:DUF4956 domain-containing protein [Clostridiales bacterium]